MASVALMSPPAIKEESGVLTRTPLLPKRKPIVPGVAARARFVKPRPNVTLSASKTSKETLPPPAENVKDAPSQPPETECEIISRPAIPKRTATIPAPSRARFQRAKPNIGLLVNKTVKDSQSSEKKSVTIPPPTNSETEKAFDEKLDVPDLSKVSLEEKCNSESAPVARSSQELLNEEVSNTNSDNDVPTLSLNMEKIIDETLSESQPISQPAIDINSVNSVHSNYQEFSSIRASTDNTALKSPTEKSSYLSLPIEPANEISSSQGVETLLTSPRGTSDVTPEKEIPAPSASANKSIEYPTLKNILNSPRKRTTTKKVHERRKRVSNLSSTPSRSEMTMVDLIYWNPSSSPMKEVKKVVPTEEDLLPADDPPPPSTDESESCSIGPKVIINDDGEIILDESSLFVRRKDTVDHSVAAIVENDNTTYSSFRNRSFKTWSNRETVKFYKALSLVGTDFALMENIFKEDGKVTRTRRELKLKFKKEEKIHPKFVHTAIYELQTYNLDILDEDQDIEFLDESELIDDAPKQPKKAAISGTKTPGKRGRKKKSESVETIINENTLDSVSEAGDQSLDAIDSLSNQDVLRNENGTDSNLKSSRPERIRKAKILSDYVTNADDLSDSNDSEEETLPIKKRKRAQVLSDDENASTEALDNNSSIINDNNSPEKSISVEEFNPEGANDVDNGISGAVHFKKRRKLHTLPKIIEESSENCSSLPDAVLETSRSGRKIKIKKMSDFITDPDSLSDSDDDIIPLEKVQEINEVLTCEENVESLNAVESECQLPNSTQLEEEFSVIPLAGDSEYPEEQSIICTLDVENPDETNFVIEPSPVINQSELGNTEIMSATETVLSITETESAVVTSEIPLVHNSLRLTESSEVCNDINTNNMLTDPAITEVVITSDLMPRRARRKVLPNLVKGSKRPPIHKKPILPSRRTSFTSFTPVEDEFNPKTSFMQTTKTYSKGSYTNLIKSEEPGNMPEYLETIQKSPMTISRKRSLSGPAKSPCSPEVNSRTNSSYASVRSPLSNAPLNVFSFNSEFKPIVSQSSKELPMNTTTDDPNSANANPENIADSSPVVFLARTPNNSNMLHLFVYKKS